MFRDIEKMKRRRAAIIKEARELLNKADQEERSLAADEKEKYDRIMEDVRSMDDDIQREEHLQQLEMSDPANQVRDHDPERDRAEWRSLGEFVQTLYSNPSDKRLRGREVELRQPPPQEMDTGAAGGFLVPDQFSQELLTVQPDEVIIRPRATKFNSGDANLFIPALQYSGENMYAGAAVTWISEGATKPETSINFKQIQLQPQEVAAHVRVTDKLLRNAPMVEQIVRTQLRGALLDAEEDAFLTGAARPLGIVDHPATIQVANTADLYDDLASMLESFRGRRGVWICNRAALSNLMEIEDGANRYIWQPNARDGNPGTLFGYPVLFSDHAPDWGNDGMIVLADLSYYLIADGVGVSLAISPHVHFTENITVIKAFKTVDGEPWLTGPLPTNPESSPFVQLQA